MPPVRNAASNNDQDGGLCYCGCGKARNSTAGKRHRRGLGPMRVCASVLAQNTWLREPVASAIDASDVQQPTMGRRARRVPPLQTTEAPISPPGLTANPPRRESSSLPMTPQEPLRTIEQHNHTGPIPPPTVPIASTISEAVLGNRLDVPLEPNGNPPEMGHQANNLVHEDADMDYAADYGGNDLPQPGPAVEVDINSPDGLEMAELHGSTSALSNQRRSARLAQHIDSIAQSRWVGPQQPLDEEEDSAFDPGRDGSASWVDLPLDEDEEEELDLRQWDLLDYPVAEPGQEGISLWELQAENFMQQLAGIDGQLLDASDVQLLKAYTLKVNQRLTHETYEMMRNVFEEAAIPTLKKAESRVQALSGFQPVRYDCCRSSCVCYLGPYEDLEKCPKCQQERLRPDGKPYAYFEYLPLIPRLTALASNSVYAEKMRYRSKHDHDPDVYKDVFDGSHYQSLLHKFVVVGGHQLPSYFFSDPRDVALGLSSDGFGPFKHRNKTAWPLVLFNYNLSPEERFQKDNIISLGTIPGPKKPADIDSFLWPFVQEMVQLAIGVAAFDAISKQIFMLRAFLILVFGDIPAVSMLIRMKGHNAFLPCRMCEIKGVRVPESRATTHYVPLDRSRFPDNPQPASYEPESLPLRTHDRFLAQAKEVNFASTATKSDDLAMEYGIKGVPLLSALTSLSFPISFPYDFMHLIWANLILNLIRLWTGKFKDLGHEGEEYFLAPEVWEAIGEATARAGDTIPSAYGARVPNLASEKSNMTAESYSIWTFYIAPTLLHNRFLNREVYNHFVELVRLLLLCLEYEMTAEQVNDLERGFRDWVVQYERIYYKLDPGRASCCPVTVHALLHIAPSIRAMGPVWAYWAFPMERYCGDILRNIRSRRYPYISINRYVTSRAQLAQLKNLYNLHSVLDLKRKRSNCHEHTFPDYPDFVLSEKSKEAAKILSLKLWRPIKATLGTHFDTSADTFQLAIPKEASFAQYGRLRRLGGGDTFHASKLIASLPDSRDMTFVRYHLLVDKHARSRNRTPEYEEQVHFGQLLRILVIPLPAIAHASVPECTVLYAVVKPVKILCRLDCPFDIPIYRTHSSTVQLVHLDQIKCVVGRIPVEGGWAIVDRSTTLASSLVTQDSE